MDEPVTSASPSQMLMAVGAAFCDAMVRGMEEAPWYAYARSLEVTWLDLSAEQREARMAASRETSWRALDLEPPLSVTRLVSADGLHAVIRGAECWYEGAGHSNWAYVLCNGKPRIPGPDSSVPEAEGDDSWWVCWDDLDYLPSWRWQDDTANDRRGPAGA